MELSLLNLLDLGPFGDCRLEELVRLDLFDRKGFGFDRLQCMCQGSCDTESPVSYVSTKWRVHSKFS
jgi:hypothetical protein